MTKMKRWNKNNPRMVVPILKGESNGRAKLTEDGVRYILAAYQENKSYAQCIAMLGGAVSETTIRQIIKGKTWRHIV